MIQNSIQMPNSFSSLLAHAKGLLVEGKFEPTEVARTLSIASHFNNASTPVLARFSVGGGIPHIADVDDQATPKGVAIRFQLDRNTHTDLINHSFNGFATRTGEDFLAFLQHLRAAKIAEVQFEKAQGEGVDHSEQLKNLHKAQAAFQDFLDGHPAAATFVRSPKPNPHNYGTITYYEPNTHVLTNQDAKITNVRYRLIPADGDLFCTDPEQLKRLGPSYLEDDLQQRFPQKPIVFTLQAHIASPDDTLDDATISYKGTTFVTVGKLEINKVADDNPAKQKEIAFSPSPDEGGVEGIASSKDPLIQTRQGVYRISAGQRRSEAQGE